MARSEKYEHITCPVTGRQIERGEGNAVMDSNGNVWIVHKSAGPHVRTDPSDGYGPPTINGKAPYFGPDAP